MITYQSKGSCILNHLILSTALVQLNQVDLCTHASSPGCRRRSCMNERSSPFTRTSRTHDLHFLTSLSELRNANSCILISSDTIGSMNDQNDWMCVWDNIMEVCVVSVSWVTIRRWNLCSINSVSYARI